MSAYAPALYEADKHYVVPRITNPDYIDIILDICIKEKITGVLSLIDPELALLAANIDRFTEIGVTVIGSCEKLCNLAFDKIQMYYWLKEHGYACARSYLDRKKFNADVEAGKITYPVFVKPVCGSASIAIQKVFDKDTVEFLCSRDSRLMIQEFLEGQEIGADCYVDMISGKVISIFTKKKLLMRAGETDKAISFKDEKLFAYIERFLLESGFQGPVDIDIFEINGEFYISEVNPRFGGGYPHAYAAGVDHMRLIVENLSGRENRRNIGSYHEGVVMMKYVETMIMNQQDLVN